MKCPPFDGLDDDRLALLVGRLELLEVQGSGHVIPGELSIHRLQRVLESVISDARSADPLAVDGECRANRRKPRTLQLAGEVEVRAGDFGRSRWHVDLVVRVDSYGAGRDFRHAWINLIGSPSPRRPQRHLPAHSSDGRGQEVSP
ncbi:hypothetical protein ACYOEI_07755 [Singulisphaera rosea]